MRLSCSSEAEDEHEGLVDRAELVCVEAPDRSTQSLAIDDRRLLDKNTRLLAL
jgi:hypothetical protein